MTVSLLGSRRPVNLRRQRSILLVPLFARREARKRLVELRGPWRRSRRPIRRRPMTIRNRSVHINGGVSPRVQSDSLTYISLVSGLLSEMALMIRATETRTFEPPFKLL